MIDPICDMNVEPRARRWHRRLRRARLNLPAAFTGEATAFGILLGPMIASTVMCFSAVSMIANALGLNKVKR